MNAIRLDALAPAPPPALPGAGPRVCIGQMLAMNEAVLILASLAQRYQLRLAPGCVVQPHAQVTLRPKYGLKMTIEHRRSPSP